MWHRVTEVAKTRRINEEALVRFAEDNSNKFGIVNEFGYSEVNTWHVDDLVKEFNWIKNEVSSTH